MGNARSNRFTKQERVVAVADVKRIFAAGKRYSCSGMRLIVLPNELQYNRVVITPTRAFRTAVARNRGRRRMREIYRRNKSGLLPGFDTAVVLFPGNYTYIDREKQLMQLWRSAGLLRQESEWTEKP